MEEIIIGYLCLDFLIMYSLVILAFYICFNLTYFIFGYFPFISARKLNVKEKEDVKKHGISHCTTQAGYEGIRNSSRICGSKFRKAYSNHFRKCVFFFADAYDNEDALKFNHNIKYQWKVSIQNLTDEQIEKMSIREYDKVLMYDKNFEFDRINEVVWTPLDGKLYSKKEKVKYYLKEIFHINYLDKYTRRLWLSALISFIIVCAVFAPILILILT